MSRFELWKDWNKHCLNHPVYKFLVLIGLAYSPSFDMHCFVKGKFEQYPSYEYSLRDEKPEKKSTTNWGWYTVYLLMVIVNSVMCSLHGFTISTWQHWVYFWMLVLCFVSGANYRKKENTNETMESD